MNEKLKQLLTKPLASLIIFLLIYSFVTLYFWDGIGPGDVGHYVTAALKWNETGAYLGDNHWSLRYLLVLQMAFFFSLFGPSEFLASAPNILYGGLLVLVTFHFSRRHFGVAVGNIFTLLMATSAFFAIQAAEVRIYGVEIFYVVLSLWLFIEATSGAQPNLKILFLTGLAAGAAWLCREATIFLPLTLGAAALLMNRSFFRIIIPVALGYLTVIVGELVLYGFAAGNPLYRYETDLAHGNGSPSMQVGGPSENQELFDYLTYPITELVSFTNVSPFVFLAAIALVYLLRRGALNKSSNLIFIIFGLSAALSFVISSYVLSLENVVYYPIVPYASLLVSSVAIAALYKHLGKIVLVLTTLAFVAINFAAADFRDYDEYSEARSLTQLALAYDEPIYSDRLTTRRATTLLRLRGETKENAQHFVKSSEIIPKGALIYQATPKGARYAISASPNWIEIEHLFPREPSWTKSVLRKLIPTSFQTPRLSEILQTPNPVILYRTPM
jgi:4-amino-4-deoxy-L-arabinose transferase-like glycosyltransferase